MARTNPETFAKAVLKQMEMPATFAEFPLLKLALGFAAGWAYAKYLANHYGAIGGGDFAERAFSVAHNEVLFDVDVLAAADWPHRGVGERFKAAARTVFATCAK